MSEATNHRLPDETPLREKPINEVAATLQEILGQQLTAYAICETNPRRIGVFARGEAAPDADVEPILRDLAEVTEAVTKNGSPEMTRALMMGMNPRLGDQAPIQLFHEGESAAVLAASSGLGLLDSDYR